MPFPNKNKHTETETQVELQINDVPKKSSSKKGSSTTVGEDNPKFRSTLDKINFFSRINFFYGWYLLFMGWKKDKTGEFFQDSEMVTFSYAQRSEVMEGAYMDHLKEQKRKNPNKAPSIALAVLSVIKLRLFLSVLSQIYTAFLRIFSAWVMKRLIDCYLDPEKATTDAYWWAAILCSIFILALYGEHHWIFLIANLGAHVRTSVISMLYTKIGKLSTYTINKLSAGKLINMATNDVNIFEMLMVFVPGLFSSLAMLLAGSALIWIYFGVKSLIGIGYMLAILPIQFYLAQLSVKPLEERNLLTDERARKISEAIVGIRLLKMYTWEIKFKDFIAGIRRREMMLTRKILIFINVLMRAIAWSAQYMAAFLIFMLHHVTGGELKVSEVFSAYFVLGFMRIYLLYMLTQSGVFISEARLLFRRLDKIMDAPEMEKVVFEAPVDSSNSVEFDHFSAYWQKDSDQDGNSNKPVVNDLTLNLKKGSLNAIVGTVGSSKTSLLYTFTGQMPQTSGKLRFKGKIAFAEQEPTIFAGTFKENILFGKSFDEVWYNKVVKACNLENDLKLFPQGDMSMIGEAGNNLSGGQKARLALARAIYADADIYLLDDPLSAVDAKVAKSMYNEAIEGLLKDKTVLLVTHRVYFVQNIENIIVLDKGKMIGKGSFHELKSQGVDVNTIFSINEKTQTEEVIVRPAGQKEIKQEGKSASQEALVAPSSSPDSIDESQESEVIQPPADKYGGQVSIKTYISFFSEVGWGVIFLVLFFYLFTQFGEVAFGRIIGAWLGGQFNLGESLGSLGGIALYMIFIHLVKNMTFVLAFTRVAKKYHKKMLDRLVRAKVSFFDENPVGQILSRFTWDMGVLDKFIPMIGMDVMDIVFIVGSIFITISIMDPVLIGPLAGYLVILVVIIVLIFPSIKQTKGYHMMTSGPVFSLYSASISGSAIIRIYEQADTMKQKFTQFLHINNKANLNFLLTSTLLGLFVDISYNIIAIGMIYITTARIHPDGEASTGAISAFSMVMIMSVTGVFQWGVRMFCQTNILISSAARVQAYCNLPSEAPLALPQDKEHINKSWPQSGNINFSQVSMKYNPESDYVIKDLNLEIKAGEKIGCVGRTGAGKSSTINLLFRLQEIDKKSSDNSIVLDGVNTQEVGLHLLRGNISIIPQVPFTFTGTIKENIDPLNQYSEAQIWNVIEEVGLKDLISKLPGGLQANMANASDVFSVGQKQLVCLARVLLRPGKILVLDEATANMDTKTDDFIQLKIRERFSDATVFTIAHRLSTIANYDKVLVLDKGQKKEFDHPYKLLVKNIGDTTVTNTEGHFGSMVMNTGPKASQQILDIAKETYEKKYGKL